MKSASSTRVKAPNLNSASGDRLYDSAALKLPGRRGVVDDNLVSGECIKEKKDKNDKSTKNGQSVVSGTLQWVSEQG